MNETQRTEHFNQLKQQLEKEGYCSEKCTISVLKANAMAFVTAGPIAIACCVIFFLFHPVGKFQFSLIEMLLFYAVIIANIFVHELLHGLTWGMFCKNGWKSIHFGVIWKKVTPYCCCTESLQFHQYLLGGLMPLLVLGIGGFILAMGTGSLFWLIVCVFNILGAGGDTTIALMLLKHKEALIIDHPTECGFWAFCKKTNN